MQKFSHDVDQNQNVLLKYLANQKRVYYCHLFDFQKQNETVNI